MNDELFNRSSAIFTTVTNGAETQYHREILLPDNFTIQLVILDSGNMAIFYRPGTPDKTTRLCHFYFANDLTIASYSRPHLYVALGGSITREKIYELIMSESDAAFEWLLWNQI